RLLDLVEGLDEAGHVHRDVPLGRLDQLGGLLGVLPGPVHQPVGEGLDDQVVAVLDRLAVPLPCPVLGLDDARQGEPLLERVELDVPLGGVQVGGAEVAVEDVRPGRGRAVGGDVLVRDDDRDRLGRVDRGGVPRLAAAEAGEPTADARRLRYPTADARRPGPAPAAGAAAAGESAADARRLRCAGAAEPAEFTAADPAGRGGAGLVGG